MLRVADRPRDQRDTRQITAKAARHAADRLDAQMEKLLKPIKRNGPNERFAKHLWKHRNQLFSFLRHKDIGATNYRAEQALRPAVVNRKVWGGNRSQDGAVAQSILMTVLFTAQKQGRDAMRFLSQVLRSPPQHRPLLLAGSG